jgi:hypothetical protein
MEKQWQSNGNFYVINHHDGKIYKDRCIWNLNRGQMVIQRMVVRLIFSQRRFLDLNRVFVLFICRLAELILKTVLLVVEEFLNP